MAKRGPKPGQGLRYYTVYLRKTDEIIAFGTAEQCAEQLGFSSAQTFQACVCKTRAEKNEKYTRYEFMVEKTPYDEEKEKPMKNRRLIDANALTELEALDYIYRGGYPFYRAGDVWDCIDAAPTVDAVEVIRCRDCKWYGSNYPEKIPPSCRNINGLVCTEPFEFCSRAERRE